MDRYDKAKLKVLIKMILIQKSPKRLTANQLTEIINKYNWGFRTSITSAKIGRLLAYELKKHDKNFLSNVKASKRRGILVYSIPSKNEK